MELNNFGLAICQCAIQSTVLYMMLPHKLSTYILPRPQADSITVAMDSSVSQITCAKFLGTEVLGSRKLYCKRLVTAR